MGLAVASTLARDSLPLCSFRVPTAECFAYALSRVHLAMAAWLQLRLAPSAPDGKLFIPHRRAPAEHASADFKVCRVADFNPHHCEFLTLPCFSNGCRLEIRDTADQRSALRASGFRSR